jgi:phage shock protein PspC (stress-responsive transcriptional regulator)
MDKIEKIHIAKVVYNIEPKAEKNLKEYLNDVRGNLEVDTAEEVIEDIESRIPEILAERKINANDVITQTDVNAIKKQLGNPEQFLDDSQSDKVKTNPRKLFLDKDSAYIGGVAAGISKYLNIDVIIIRIVFFLLIFFYGIGIVLYLLLWAVLPTAKTGSDKLQMSGLPVTAASLQTYRASIQHKLGDGTYIFRDVLINIIRVIAVIFCAGIALFMFTILGILSGLTYVYPFRPIFVSYSVDYFLLGLLWLICLSLIGLLITVTVRLWGRRSRQLKVSALFLLAAFIVGVAGTGALGLLTYNHFSDKYGNGRTATALTVNNVTPTIFPTSLKVESGQNLSLTYVVTNQAIHATYEAWPGLGKPIFYISSSNGVLSVNSGNLAQAAPQCFGSMCQKIYLPIRVTLYGPAVSNVVVNNGATLWVNNANFGNSVSFSASHWSEININNSYANNMNISATNWSNIQTNNTSSVATKIVVDSTSSVDAPVTNTLSATIEGNCNQLGDQVLFLNSEPETITVNGQLQTPNNLSNNNNACIGENF